MCDGWFASLCTTESALGGGGCSGITCLAIHKLNTALGQDEEPPRTPAQPAGDLVPEVGSHGGLAPLACHLGLLSGHYPGLLTLPQLQVFLSYSCSYPIFAPLLHLTTPILPYRLQCPSGSGWTSKSTLSERPY